MSAFVWLFTGQHLEGWFACEVWGCCSKDGRGSSCSCNWPGWLLRSTEVLQPFEALAFMLTAFPYFLPRLFKRPSMMQSCQEVIYLLSRLRLDQGLVYALEVYGCTSYLFIGCAEMSVHLIPFTTVFNFSYDPNELYLIRIAFVCLPGELLTLLEFPWCYMMCNVPDIWVSASTSVYQV